MTDQELTPKDKQELKDREQTRAGRTYVPDVDIREDEHALWLWADMPGVDQDSVEVELHDDVLRLEGRVSTAGLRRPVTALHRVQRRQLPRRFTLANGERFDRDKVSARLVNGVLEVKLPKAEKAKPRRIEVQVS